MSPEAHACLHDIIALLRTAEVRRFYTDGDGQGCAIWADCRTPSDEFMDAHGRTPDHDPVVTIDATGYGGGGWGDGPVSRPGIKEQFFFDRCDRAPRRSSNWREFVAAKRIIIKHASRFSNRRVILRTDNFATMSIINNEGSMSMELNSHYRELLNTLRLHNIELTAVHIKGLLNHYADALSRWKRTYDDQDWQLSPEIFRELGDECGPFVC